MQTKKKNLNADTVVSGGLSFINSILQNAGGEVNRALKTASVRGRRSAQTLRRTVDGLITNINADDLRRKAVATSGVLRKEIKKLSHGVRTQIRTVEGLWDDRVIDNMVERLKDNFSSTVEKIQDLEVLEYAKNKVNDTKKQVLSALEIPSHSDVATLTRKLSVLEKKLDAIKKREVRV